MKVLHLVHNYYGFSGASRQAKSIASGIAESYPNIQQRFFTLESGNKKVGEIVKDRFFIYVSNKQILSRVFNLIKIIIQYRPDVAHFHGADFALLLVCKLMGVKVYWKTTLYGSDDFATLVEGQFGFIKKQLIKLISINNTLTRQIYDINKRYLSKERLVTIPNGVAIPDRKSFSSKEKIAVIVSAIIPRKAVLDGILFFNKHLRQHGFRLYIVGPNSDKLDGFSSDYATECNCYGDEEVIFMGELPHHETLTILSKARFLIHMSRHEGMPNVVLESMAYGVYPIVSNMNGLADELVAHNINGFNVDKNDLFHFDNFDFCNENGFNFIASRFSLNVIAANTVMVYKRVIA